MKKLLSLLLLFTVVLSLFACGGENTVYPPKASTAEESRVVMRLSFGNETYEVKYELYRALFLSLTGEVDGGDRSVYSGAEKDEYIRKIDALIARRAADIFAAIRLAKDYGFDAYGKDADERVREAVRISVEGGDGVFGYDGDYDAYLASLAELGMNYSVQDLLFRYAFAYDAVMTHFAGYTDGVDPRNDIAPVFDYTADDVRTFFDSPDVTLVLLATLESEVFTEKRAKEMRDAIADLATPTEVKNYIIGHSSTVESDVNVGLLIGKYNLDEAYFSEVTKAAEALYIGGTSEPIEVSAEGETYYYILYRTDKTDDYFETYTASVTDAYLRNEAGKALAAVRDGMLSGLTREALLDTLDRTAIGFGE